MSRVCLILSLSCCLTGCLGKTEEDIEQFVKEVKQQRKEIVEALPKFKKLETFEYKASHLRSPFESFVPALSKHLPQNNHGKNIPNIERKKEPLEFYPLDSLEMIGILEKDNIPWAILRDKDRVVHRVGVGNYVGQNFGKIEKINKSEIEIIEWVQNSAGDWSARSAFIQWSGLKGMSL